MADVEEDGATGQNGITEPQEENHASFSDGQLSYLGQDVENVPAELIKDYSKVTQRLDLSFNRIKSLKGLEEFINIEELVLDNNEITDDVTFPALQQLHTLTLNKNKLVNLNKLLDDFKVKFPNLTYLSLLGNTACPNQLSDIEKDEEDYRRYRYYVIYRLPTLRFLDSSPIRPADVEEAQRVGPYMTVVKGTDDVGTDDLESPPVSPSNYSPLPDVSRQSSDHQGTFGKSRYVYYGKHSEGNRFIRNTDL